MAIWQYRYLILPGGSITKNNFQFDEDGLLEDDVFWKSVGMTRAQFTSLNNVLPIGDSWNKDLMLFGNESSTCFEIYFEDNCVSSVSFRIDFSTKYQTVLKSIIEFLQSKGFVIIDEDYNIIDLSFDVLNAQIENSPQFAKYHKMISD